MTKNFNTLISMNDIVKAYKSGQFPNAHCLLWNKEDKVKFLVSEQNDSLTTEYRKEIALDGNTSIRL